MTPTEAINREIAILEDVRGQETRTVEQLRLSSQIQGLRLAKLAVKGL